MQSRQQHRGPLGLGHPFLSSYVPELRPWLRYTPGLHPQQAGGALPLFPLHLISFQSPFPGATLTLTDPGVLSPLELLAATIRGPGRLFSRCTGLHTDTFVPQEAEN